MNAAPLLACTTDRLGSSYEDCGLTDKWTFIVIDNIYFSVVYTMCEKRQTLQELVIGYHMHFYAHLSV